MKDMDWQARVGWKIPEGVHPDDLQSAVAAWFRRTSADRKKAPHVILEKALMAGGKKRIKRTVRIGQHADKSILQNDDFETRYRRARKDGRKPIFDPIDEFILRYWRRFRQIGEFRFPPEVPGLQDWSPKAASSLIRILPIGEKAGGEKWYNKKRLRLGLPGKIVYRVTDFVTFQDGRWQMELR